jgi:hypothetical protein
MRGNKVLKLVTKSEFTTSKQSEVITSKHGEAALSQLNN